MAKNKNLRIDPSFKLASNFLVAICARPVTDYVDWTDQVLASKAQKSFEERVSDLRQSLAHRLEDSWISASIAFSSSQDVHDLIRPWQESSEDKRGRKIEATLLAYYSRACLRPDPFGLFSGLSLGRFSDKNEFKLFGREFHRRRMLLSSRYLSEKIKQSIHKLDVLKKSRFLPNPTIFIENEKLVCFRTESVDPRQHLDSAISISMKIPDELKELFQEWSSWREYNATLSEFVERLGLDYQEAHSLFMVMVEKGIIISDFEIPVSGENWREVAIRNLGADKDLTKELESLIELTRRVNLEFESSHHSIDAFAGLEETSLKPSDLGRYFALDLFPRANFLLFENVKSEILRAATILRKLTPSRDDPLETFRKVFVQTYGASSVPLIQVFKDMNAAGHILSQASVRKWSERSQLLLEIILQATQNREIEVDLTREQIDELSKFSSDLVPASCLAMNFELGAASAQNVKEGKFYLVVDDIQAQQFRYLGRYGFDIPEIKKELEEGFRKDIQAHPESVFTEVCFRFSYPESLVFHSRPTFHQKDLQLFGTSTREFAEQIPLRSLSLKVVEDRFFIFDSTSGKEVIPRFSSGFQEFDAFGMPPLVRFLFLMQDQGRQATFRWDWDLLRLAPFKPRVRHGRAIFSRAEWIVKGDELAHLLKLESKAALLELDRWRDARGIPRFAILQPHLFIDFHNPLSQIFFLRKVGRTKQSILQEALPGPMEKVLESDRGRHSHLCIMPLTFDSN